MRRLAAGGTETRVIEAGPADARKAVVFVHGNPGSAEDWEALVRAAGATHRAVAMDLPDFGETLAPPGFDHRPETYAAWLGEALGALGIERVHLVLHDFGGPIGLLWASARPEALASVTLIDTGILPGYRWHRMARLWRTPVVGELVQATTTKRGMAWAIGRSEPRGLPPAFARRMGEHYDSRTKRAVLRLYRATPDPGGMSDRVAALMRPLDLPALVIWGAGDAYLPSSYAERQREAFPSAEVHLLPDSGHWPFADAPETVERLLAGFLRSRATSGPTSA